MLIISKTQLQQLFVYVLAYLLATNWTISAKLLQWTEFRVEYLYVPIKLNKIGLSISWTHTDIRHNEVSIYQLHKSDEENCILSEVHYYVKFSTLC
jgi:hypothetical protein